MKIFAFILIALVAAINSMASATEYVDPNVAFSSVMKLSFQPADKKITYGYDALQYGLLWRSKEKSSSPLVVLIHGGCWLNAFGVDHAGPMASALAQKGFDVWALEYRRTGDEGGGWPGSFDDIEAALSHVPHLPEGINKQQVILVGHSAGGHLALLANAAAKKNSQPEIVKTVGLAAITDLKSYAAGQNSCQTAGPKFMGGTAVEKPEAYLAADPKQHGPYKNTVLLQGQADVIVPETQAELLGAETVKLATAGHFDWIHPHSEAFALLLKQLSSVSSPIQTTAQ